MGASSDSGYSNQEWLESAAEEIQAEEEAEREEFEELDETRQSLENRPTADGGTDDIADAEVEDDLTLEELESGYEMTDDRTVGTETFEFDGVEYEIGNANIVASNEMVDRLNEIHQRAASQRTLGAYLCNTLAEWTVADEFDLEYWQRQVSYAEANDLINALAMGGNSRLR